MILITKFVQDGLRLWTSMSRWCRPLHSVLERVTMYMDGILSVIQGKFPHAGVARSLHEMFRYKNSHSKNDSYQHDNFAWMVTMSIPPNMSTKGSRSNIHGDNEYPANMATKGSQTSIKQIHDINYMSHQQKKQYPTSNIKHGSIQHNASHSKETNKYMITLHIPHTEDDIFYEHHH